MNGTVARFLKSGRRTGERQPALLTGEREDRLMMTDVNLSARNHGTPRLEPADALDRSHVETLAATRQSTLIERRGELRRFHDRQARSKFRDTKAVAQAELEKNARLLTETQTRLRTVRDQKRHFERFGSFKKGKSKPEGEKKPSSRWIHAQFCAVVVVMMIAILNGTFSVSSVMLDSTAFSGAYAKTITIALGFFLLPGLGLSIPFHLLKSRRKLASGYLALLVVSGIGFGFLFAVTWAHTYARETGNQTMIDLTSIGLGGDAEVVTESTPWFFENANWLSLLFQILADMCFAGAAKSYLSFLSWNYHLFHRKGLQQDPEWVLLDNEEQQLSGEVSVLEGEQKLRSTRLSELEQEEDAYAESVCALADALFQKEVDRIEREEERIRVKREELEAKEAEAQRSRQELDALLTQNPGLVRPQTQKEQNS